MYEKQMRVKFWGNVLFVAAIVAVCFFYLQLDPLRLLTAAPNFAQYVAVNFFPPSFANIQFHLPAVLHTVAFALVSTAVATVLSFIAALLMSDVIMPYAWVRWLVRFIMAFMRNIPVIIWVQLMVFIFGIGSMVGLIALILATTGFLSRSYSNSIDEIAAKRLEPLRASGAGVFAVIRHGLLPEFVPSWVNWTLFTFELSIRASAVLGMVGAGGIGVVIQTQLSLRRFNEATTLILMLILIVLLTEFVTGYLRRKVIAPATAGKPDKSTKIRVMPLRMQVFRWGLLPVVMAVFLFGLWYLQLDVARFVNRLSNAPRVLRLLMDVNVDMILPGLQQFMVSFAMGVVGLVLGGLLALVLAFLAADNIAPWRPLAIAIKTFVSIVRAVPSLVIILMIVAAIGLGYTTGVVGLIISSMGYLTKAFIASIEEQDKNIITAMRSTGAKWGQIVIHGLLPAVATSFLAWVAIRLETSVAESITLGIVGAGGIGTMLSRAIRQIDYPTITVLILIIVLCMMLLEWGVSWVRRVVL
ncbi:MAG: ABC transporter permease subunit [Defluviitaleaceae bacterium]|nr:ABC transporter permease subunit [Defluviitaleaceae bacterium]